MLFVLHSLVKRVVTKSFFFSSYFFSTPPSTKKRLANFVDRPEIEGCLLTQCGLKLNSCDAHCFTREEIPKEVVRIVKEKNHWWYKERRKERNL